MQKLKDFFLLDPEITYLNFGSFGACPKPVFDTYQEFQRELEREPVRFIVKNGPAYLETSLAALAKYINCKSSNLVFTPNPTHAINIIARGIDLKKGEEVLTTDLEYGAMDRTWNFYCAEKGARYIRQKISLPMASKEQFIEEFFAGVSANTRVIFISHITSSTALRLPVREICEQAKQKGLITIVDGAHAPGQVAVDLSELKADIYTGACHKWMMTPKGSSFLYVTDQLKDTFDPLIVSWGYESTHPSGNRFFDYHQFNGTRDFSAYLTIPAAIQFMKENNWEAVAESCRSRNYRYIPKFSELLHTTALAPVSEEWLVQMASFKINTGDPGKLNQQLIDKYKIEIPVMQHGQSVYIRYSLNAFNNDNDLDTLYNALAELVSKKILL